MQVYNLVDRSLLFKTDASSRFNLITFHYLSSFSLYFTQRQELLNNIYIINSSLKIAPMKSF